jgi:Tfp pilus assembly protein PilO
MRIKILLLPFFIIIILVLGIGYIKPDMDVLMAKKEEIGAKEAQVDNMKTIVGNIELLKNSLDAEQDHEKLMYKYLPNTLNQEQVIDAFQLLAGQLGLTIDGMELKQSPVQAFEQPLVDSTVSSIVAGGKEFSNYEVAPVLPVVAKTFIFKGSVKGQYGNIKTFFDRMAHIERFQNVNFFSIGTSLKTAEPSKAAESDNLSGIFEAKFSYLPPKHIASAMGMPIFLQSKFDFSPVNSLLNKITSSIPSMEKGVTGKPNPFQ